MTNDETRAVLGAAERIERLVDAAADSFALGAPMPLRVIDDAREALGDVRALAGAKLRGSNDRQTK